MAAQINLGNRGEPPYMVSIFYGDEEGGFREIVLLGNGLKHAFGEPLLQGTDGSRIAAEDTACKGINLIERYFHLSVISHILDP